MFTTLVLSFLNSIFPLPYINSSFSLYHITEDINDIDVKPVSSNNIILREEMLTGHIKYGR